MNEDEVLGGLLDLLAYSGWRAYHVRRSDRALVQGRGGAGFPDVIAVHRDSKRAIAIEVKSERGVISTDQLEWLTRFRFDTGFETTVVRPSTYDQALDWIVGKGPMPPTTP